MSTPLLIQFILCPIIFFSLLGITAPYGRHNRPGWGPNLLSPVAWLLMELPAVLVITLMILSSPYGTSPQALIPLGFWLFHYLYRTFIFPALMKPSEKTFPAILVLFALAYNSLNGFNNGEAVLANATIERPWEHLYFWVGTFIFAAGFAMHFHSDSIVRNLRQPGETGYFIPNGGMFRWVSSPNYLGEIIQWIGWAILTWSLAGVAFALFTFCNLAPRALSNQIWYRKRFPNYPSKRKALIPGLF